MLTSTSLNALMSTFALSNTVADVIETADYSCNAVLNLKSYTMNQLCIQSGRIVATSNAAYEALGSLKNYALSNGQSNWNWASNTASWSSNYFKAFAAYVDVVQRSGDAIAFASNAIAKCASSNGQSNWNWASNKADAINKALQNYVDIDWASNWDWASNTVADVIKNLPLYSLAENERHWIWASNTVSVIQTNMPKYAAAIGQSNWNWASNLADWNSNMWRKNLNRIDASEKDVASLKNKVGDIATYWSTKEPGHEHKMFTRSNVVIASAPGASPGPPLLRVDGAAKLNTAVIDGDVFAPYSGMVLTFKDDYARYGVRTSFGQGGHIWGTHANNEMSKQMILRADNGFLGIGLPDNAQPQAMLQVNASTVMKNGDGMWNSVSDKRAKENIVSANIETCYENVKNIPLRYFSWRDGFGGTDKRKVGWIAQEVEQVFPKAVTTIDAHGIGVCKALNTDQLIAAMFGAIQKLQHMVEDLQAAAKSDREALAQLRGL